MARAQLAPVTAGHADISQGFQPLQSAAHGWLVAADKNPKWESLVAGFTAPVPGSEIKPDKKAAQIYDKLLEKYAACEYEALDTI